MLNNKTNQRELAYLVKIDKIEPIIGSDNCEAAVVGGWKVLVHNNIFKQGDTAIYFEIDSKVDVTKPEFEFLAKKHGRIKTQRYTFGGKNPGFYSQGLLMHPSDFGWEVASEPIGGVKTEVIIDDEGKAHYPNDESRFLTKKLDVVYSVKEDRKRKGKGVDKYQSMAQRRPEIFSRAWARWMMRREWGRKLMFLFFGRKKDNNYRFPIHFEYIHKTDQERCENMLWVLEDKTPFIRTQKCDGSSATYILERKGKKKYEFYVCSRNVRMFTPDQKNFYDDNVYWEMAIKYDIENKLKDYLEWFPDIKYVCWQGEICGPKIQKNPHKLKENHLYLFHMIDSEIGMFDIRKAKFFWDKYMMESVPIMEDDYILPNDFEEFKLTADGYYDPSVCEGDNKCRREGYVYYKTDDPNFSFKNVSRKYLLKKGE